MIPDNVMEEHLSDGCTVRREEVIAAVEKAHKWHAWYRVHPMLNHCNMEPECFAFIIGVAPGTAKASLAGNRALDEASMLILAADKSRHVRVELAQNASITDSVIDVLCASDDERVLAALAGRYRVPSAVLSRDHLPAAARNALARNQATSPEVLEKMARADERSDLVISGVFGNPATPQRLLAAAVVKEGRWSFPEEAAVSAARNSSTPEEALLLVAHRLASGSEPPRRGRTFAMAHGMSMFDALVSNPSVPASAFEALAAVKEPRSQRALAGSRYTPVDVLRGIASNSSDGSARDVAERALDAKRQRGELEGFAVGYPF